MNTSTRQVLSAIGLDEQTIARLDLFDQVNPPEGVDREADPTPVPLTLTAGQVNIIRASLRHTLDSAVGGYEQAYGMSLVMGQSFDEHMTHLREEHPDADPATHFPRYLDVEDVLASAYAEVKERATVPDFVPDEWDFS